MKILFVGRGTIATQYAWAMEKSGHCVEFFVRKGRKEVYGDSIGLEIWDARKKRKLVKENWNVKFVDEISAEHDYDVIFVSVNTWQIKSVTDYFTERVGNASVLFFNNIWQDLQSTAEPIPMNQVIFGFPGAGGGYEGNRLRGGFLKNIFLESPRSGTEQRHKEILELFQSGGFKVSLLKDIQSWLWNHFAVNAAMEIELLRGGDMSFSEMMQDSQALKNIGLNLREIVPVLKAKGSKMDGITFVFAYLPSNFVGFLLHKVIFAPNSLPRLFMEYSNNKAGAVEQIAIEAKKLKVSVPRLDCFKFDSL